MTEEKPWYTSLAGIGNAGQWVLVFAFFVALMLGVDVDTIVNDWLGKLALAWSLASLVMQSIGTMVRDKKIDPAQVLPGVRSEAIASGIGALKKALHRQ